MLKEKIGATDAALKMQQERGYVVIGYPPTGRIPKISESVWYFAGKELAGY